MTEWQIKRYGYVRKEQLTKQPTKVLMSRLKIRELKKSRLYSQRRFFLYQMTIRLRTERVSLRLKLFESRFLWLEKNINTMIL